MMKNLLYLLIALPGFVFSQNVPTPGFEDWYIGNIIQRPQGWITSNVFSVAQFGMYSVEPDWENYVQGQTSCKLSTYQEHPDSLPQAAFITNGQPQMDYVNLSINFITGGTPFPYKPAKMQGFYQYNSTSPEEDFAQARVILKKYNESTGKRDTIGLGENLLLNPAGDFVPFEVPINYLVPNVTPDSIVVIFYSSYPDFPNAGAELWLDSLTFDFSTAIEEVSEGEIATIGAEMEYFMVSPNPAGETIKVTLNFPVEGSLQIFNSAGKLTDRKMISGTVKTQEIDVSDFSAGLYFLQLLDKQGKILQTKKILIL